MNQPERNDEGKNKTDSSCRWFLKLGLAGAGAAAAVAGGAVIANRLKGIEHGLLGAR